MRPEARRPALDWRRLRRAVLARRRTLAAGLAALAVLLALQALSPAPSPTVPVLAAARDVTAGAVLTGEDVRVAALPAAAVPDGALSPGTPVTGRSVVGAVRAGEPLTDVRLVGPALLGRLPPGAVAVPVRLADADAVALVSPGQRVDVLAVATSLTGPDDATDAPAATMARGALVLAIPGRPSDDLGTDGALVLLAVPRSVAADLVGAQASRLALVLPP